MLVSDDVGPLPLVAVSSLSVKSGPAIDADNRPNASCRCVAARADISSRHRWVRADWRGDLADDASRGDECREAEVAVAEARAETTASVRVESGICGDVGASEEGSDEGRNVERTRGDAK